MRYYVVGEGLLNRREIAEFPRGALWSARLSTGVFGLTTCRAGNRGPKSTNEVILGVGSKGLDGIIRLGFIPCPACKPEDDMGYVHGATDAVDDMYSLTLKQFSDKTIVPFDARRVDYGWILPITGAPNRIYLPSSLTPEEIRTQRSRFAALGATPVLGCYDATVPGRFRIYD